MELRLFPRPRGKFLLPVLFDDKEQVCELPSQYLSRLTCSARGYSPQTVEHYGKQLKYFLEFLAADRRYSAMLIDHVVASIPGGVIDQYLAGLRVSGLADRTVRNRDVILKGFFEWLTTSESGRARSSSGYELGLKSPGGKRKMPRYVTKEQAVLLLNNLNHESQRCMTHFMYDTGLRVSEVPRVRKADIDALDHWPEEFHYLPLLVQGSKGRGGNNIKERYSLLSRAAFDRIKRYHSTPSYRFVVAKDKPAFLNSERKPITAKAIQKMILDAARRAAFPARTVSAHRLRHGTALSILQGESGQDYLEKLVLIQTQFGHGGIKSVEDYTNIPAAMFDRAHGNKQVKARFEEAQDIYDRTYLPVRSHKQRKGRKRKC